ncbi:24838_t:CDS:2, partial [Entrophospora sp. SA101]
SDQTDLSNLSFYIHLSPGTPRTFLYGILLDYRGNLPKSKSKSTSNEGQPIDVIICNSTSYVELLYLAFRYDPIFTQIYSSTNELRPISLWKAINQISSYPELEPSSPGIKTLEFSRLINDDYIKNSKRPIVIFPEGTTSNGKALLKFIPIFRDLTLPSIKNIINIHIISVRYDYNNFSPTIPVGNKLWHLARLCGEFKNTLKVRFLNPEESPSSPNFNESSTLSQSASSSILKQQQYKQDEEIDKVGFQIINLLGQLSRFRKTNL